MRRPPITVRYLHHGCKGFSTPLLLAVYPMRLTLSPIRKEGVSV